MSAGRWLLDAGKELIAVIVHLIAESPAPPRAPRVHPRHRVVARPIGERPTHRDNPRHEDDGEGGRH